MSDDARFPTPRGILETVIYCEDLSSAQSFYEGTIGLTLVSSEPGRHLFFRVGDSMLLIFNPKQTREATVPIGDQVIPRHGPVGPGHFAFRSEASELPGIKDRLQTAGVGIEAEIEWPGGGRSIYCRDPSGNSVEFATRTLWF